VKEFSFFSLSVIANFQPSITSFIMITGPARSIASATKVGAR
jgi:hypothetical protein